MFVMNLTGEMGRVNKALDTTLVVETVSQTVQSHPEKNPTILIICEMDNTLHSRIVRKIL